MERIDRNTWRTDNGDEVRAQGLTVTVEFGEKTKAEVLCAVEAVRAENEKLRELVRDLYRCGDECTHCKHWNQGDGFYCNLGVGWKARRMRELGIGADDD